MSFLLIAAVVVGLLPAHAQASRGSVPERPRPSHAIVERAGGELVHLVLVACDAERNTWLFVVLRPDPPLSVAKSAFGELLAHTGTDTQPYAFSGEPYDPNSGFQYQRARWMDPTSGRFAGMDPHPGIQGSPRTLHRYLYVAGNPVNDVDPTGLISAAELGSVAGALTSIAAMSIPRLQGVMATVNVNYFRIQRTIEYVGTGLQALEAAGAWVNILDNMATNLTTTEFEYSNGPGPRGLEVGRNAGQNLADNFPVVDDWDPQSGTVTSIKSTVQNDSPGTIGRLAEGWVGELDGIDDDLRGQNSNGRRIVIPYRDIRRRNLLIVIPDEPVTWSGPALTSRLRSLSRVFQTSIRVVPVRNLRGRP